MSDDGGARILVVDDVPENVRLLEALLTPRGYDVITASDGAAALELVESAKPGPRPARRRDAAARRLRRLPASSASARRPPCCR